MIYIFQIKLPGTMALPEGWLFQQQNSRPFPLAFDTHNVSLHPLLINDLSCGSVFFFSLWRCFVQCSSSHFTLPSILNCWSLSFTGEVLLKNPENGNNMAPVAWFRRIHVTWERKWDAVICFSYTLVDRQTVILWWSHLILIIAVWVEIKCENILIY